MRGRSRQVLVSARVLLPPPAQPSGASGLCGFSSRVMYVHFSSEHLETKPSGRALAWRAVQESLVSVTHCHPSHEGCLCIAEGSQKPGGSQEALLSIVLETLAGGVQGGVGGVSLRGGPGDAAHARLLAALVGESLARTPWGLKA